MIKWFAVLILLLPTVAASPYTVTLDPDDAWVNRGEGIPMTVRVEASGEPVANAEVVITGMPDTITLVTGDNGTASTGLHLGRSISHMRLQASLTRVFADGAWQEANATATAAIRWTAVHLLVRTAGENSTIAATWAHNGGAVPGLRVTLDDRSTIVLDAAGRGEAMTRSASVAVEDRPHGIKAVLAHPPMLPTATPEPAKQAAPQVERDTPASAAALAIVALVAVALRRRP